MPRTDAPARPALRLERTYQAPPERVFDAWIHPEAIAHWFAPSADYETVVTALDARAGGRYRIEMRHSGGTVHVVTGVYRELAPPSKLVMTWGWEGEEGSEPSLVTVELAKLDSGTRLVLVHEQFPNDEARAEHEKGWTACLGRLGPFLNQQQ